MRSKPIRAVRLVPLTMAEYPAWEAHVVAGYAEAQVRSGHWTAEKALEMALHDTRGLLPHGPVTPGQYLWCACDARTGVPVGGLWIALRDQGGHTEAFVYNVHVDPAQQGGGYGRAIMMAGAVAAKALGADVVALNVHGYNERAYSLYKSLGYQVANRHMRLAL